MIVAAPRSAALAQAGRSGPGPSAAMGAGTRPVMLGTLGLVFGIALYGLLAPQMPTPRYPYGDLTFFLFVFANAVMFGLLGTTRPKLATVTFWLFFAYFVLLPGYFQLHDRFRWSFDPAARSAPIILSSLVMTGTGLLATLAGQVVGDSLLTNPPPTRATTARDLPLRLVGLIILGLLTVAMTLASIKGLGSFLIQRRDRYFDVNPDLLRTFLLSQTPKSLVALAFFLWVAKLKDDWGRLRQINPLWLLGMGLPVLATMGLINNPLTVARFWFFGIMFGLAMFWLELRSMWLRLGFFIGTLLAAFVALPILDLFARSKEASADLANFSLVRHYSDYMVSADLNQLPMLMNAAFFVERQGYAMGRQLLSTLLFFVPRTIWTTKAVPAGPAAAEASGYDFLIVSMPLYGEFFMDAGLVFVLVGGFAVGIGLSWLDGRLDRARRDRDAFAALWICAYVGLSIMIYRGSLQSMMAPIVSFLFMFGLVRQLLPRRPVLSGPPVDPGAASAPHGIAGRWQRLAKARTTAAGPALPARG